MKITTSKKLLIYFCVFISGCSSSFLRVESTNISAETRIGDLSPENQESLIALNRGTSGENIFDQAKAITINGYRILFSDNDKKLYIVKDKKVIASISDEEQSIYLDDFSAPSIGTEKISIIDNYIKYTNGTFTFEDYGLDGLDVKYRNGHLSEEDVSYLNNQKCDYTLVGGAACCRDENGKLKGYLFSWKSGWEKSGNLKLNDWCLKKDKQALQ